MSYITTTGTIIATLTRYGREMLADNSSNFKITKYKLSDDEIDYSLFDGSSIDAANPTLSTFPVLEACTFGNKAAQRYALESFPFGTQQVSRLATDIPKWGRSSSPPLVDGSQNTQDWEDLTNFRDILLLDWDKVAGQTLTFAVRTLYGNDPTYYASSRNSSIIAIPTTLITSYPCPDPYETTQDQTQATVSYTISLKGSTLVPAFDATFINNFKNQIKFLSNLPSGSDSSGGSVGNFITGRVEPSGDEITPPGNGGGTTPGGGGTTPGGGGTVPGSGGTTEGVFSQRGICQTVMEVKGTNTGSNLPIDVIIFSGSKVRSGIPGF